MSRAQLRAGLPLVLLAVTIVVAALLTGPGADGPPLDPRSAAPDGTKALVDVLAELGADVRLADTPREDDAAALLLTDTLDDDRRAALEGWVADGGRLVVADPASPLTPEPAGDAAVGGLLDAPLERGCDLPALRAVDEVEPGGTSVLYTAGGAAVDCFGRDGGAWLVVSERGRGVVVALGGPEVLTNRALGAADHAQLAAALLAPEPGAAVTFLRPRLPGDGETSVTDLVPPVARAVLWQLLVAFLLLVAWRARRLGRPLEEDPPVHVPGSELVAATGNLLQQGRAVRRAAALLRTELRRFAAARLGLPPGRAADELARRLAERTGVGVDEAQRILAGPPPGDEAALLALARDTERLRAALTGPPPGARPGGPETTRAGDMPATAGRERT